MAKRTRSQYDTIVIGAGTAGCVFAERLSADPAREVLLIEAGPSDRSLFVHVPMGMGKLMAPGRRNWGFQSEPEPTLGGRRLYCPRGKGWGGSSSINGMAFVRGHPLDFDDWAARGARGWSYQEVLPFFRRLESYEGGADAYRGDAGPVAVTRPVVDSPIDEAFLEGGRELGHPQTDDFNGAQQEGFGLYDQMIQHGRRVSGATAYLRPALRRPNFTLLDNALVLRILVENGRATGVEIADGHGTRIIRCCGEVIVAAGAIQSPQLLLLSGIGPADELGRIGISAHHHLEGVGRGLKNHSDTFVQYRCTRPVSLYGRLRSPALAYAALRWAWNRSGVLASNNWHVGAFLKTTPDAPAPDMQFMLTLFAWGWGGIEMEPWHGFQIHLGGQKPLSEGRVFLKSADPAAAPGILMNYLSHPQDRRVLRDGIRMARALASTRAFDSFRGEETFPGRQVASDADLDRFLTERLETAYHPVGTCRMGSPQDVAAVVDPTGRVIGLEGLYVGDASIMPDIPNSNINAATIMIAEKIAAGLLARAGKDGSFPREDGRS